jgi:hypothetical protein
MADRTFASLIPRINPNVPGCPQPLMESAIRIAAIRTCERTLAWRIAQPTYDLTPAVHQYFYRKPADADVHAVIDAAVNGFPLDRLTLEEALLRYPAWADLYSGVDYSQLWTEGGTFNNQEFNEGSFNAGSTFTLTDDALENTSEPRIFTQLGPDQFIVLPSPDDAKAYTLRLIYALKPKRNATGMPEAIFDELEDTIFHGALQDLLVMPNQAWKDRELAAYHARQFTYHVTERRARANIGNARGTVYARMQRFD